LNTTDEGGFFVFCNIRFGLSLDEVTGNRVIQQTPLPLKEQDHETLLEKD
jgi:hypothetical protein